MAYSEKLVNRIREALVDQKKVAEKPMFGGICFMVNDKMCVCVREEEMMFRVGQAQAEQVEESNGVRPMVHNGRIMKGFVFVREEGIRTKKDFDHWISMALAFNKEAKPAKKKKSK